MIKEFYISSSLVDWTSAVPSFFIIYIMLLSDLEKLLSVWENVLSIENVT